MSFENTNNNEIILPKNKNSHTVTEHKALRSRLNNKLTVHSRKLINREQTFVVLAKLAKRISHGCKFRRNFFNRISLMRWQISIS